jgi:hypothetical protein
MKCWAAALFCLAGCVDDDLCPLVTYTDAFELVLSSETWSSAQYSIDVSFTDTYGMASFECVVPVPALPALDAGMTLLPDAGVDARGRFACRPNPPSWRLASGRAGQELVLNFEGTPPLVTVVVRDGEREVLRQDVALSYQIVRPYGEDCIGPQRAAARIELPQ